MGQKVHPIGFRIGVIRGWQTRWYAEKDYQKLLKEDLRIRQHIHRSLPDAGIPRIEIDRPAANQIVLTVFTAKPGIVIGKGGQRVDQMKNAVERMTGKRVRISIHEIRQADLDAYLVAKNIAEQIERRVAYKRAIKHAIARTMKIGAKGIKVRLAGRLGGSEMSRKETDREGRVPLHTLRADIDYGQVEAHTTLGRIGVKVWIYKGEVLPEYRRPAPEERAAREVAV